MASHRQKKRDIATGLRELRARPGWDPSKHVTTSRTEALRERLESDRVGGVLHEAERCERCAALRAAGDPTALCPEHLRAAMGL